MAPRKLRRSEEGLLLLAVILGGVFALVYALEPRLYFVAMADRYLVLHTLLELASVLVSFAVFIVNWEASKQNRNAQSLFVATGFLAVSALGTMHIFSYEGMPAFLTANTTDKAIYYWLASNYWSALVLWAAAHVRPHSRRKFLRRYLLAGANLLVSVVVLLVVTLFGSRLPSMFVEGQGLTPLKIALEYGAVAVSLMALVAHFRLYRSTRDEAIVLIMAALVANVYSGLAFTVYYNPYDVYNLLGHFYKVIVYYLIFRALLITSVHRPYVQLSEAKESLERTVSELDGRNRELDALDDIAVALSSTLKPDEILESAIEKVMAVMAAEAGAIFLLDDGTERMRLSVWKGLTPDAVESCRLHPLRLSVDLDSEGRAVEGAVAALGPVRTLGAAPNRISPLGACTCAPIMSKGRLLGAIAVVGNEGKSFAVRDADLLTAIGYQLGLAIENARLYEQTDERLREKVHELERAERRSRLLSEVGALLGSTMELERVARMIAEVVGDWCSIYLLDDREKLLRLEACYHQDDERLKTIRELLRRHPIGFGEGLTGQVARTGEPVLVTEVSQEEIAAEVRETAQSVEEIVELRRITPLSRLAVPLRAPGRTLGVLLIAATHTRQPLDEADLSLAMNLADRIGVAIENRWLLQESQAQRRHLETIISQMVDGVVVTDEAGAVSIVNEAAKRMLGEEMGRLLGSHGKSPHDPEAGTVSGNGRASRELLVPRALDGVLILGESITVGSATGEKVYSASASPLRNESGEITGAVVVLRDVTAEREVERMKDEFVAVVSHELRTPITAVLGYTDILLRGLRGPMAPKQTEALSAIRAATQRLLVLINDLLDASRLEAGKQELFLGAVDLASAADRALASVGVLAASKGISMVQSVCSGLPPVLADDEQLQRILGNLLSNAIKFTPEGGTVTILAKPYEGEAGSLERRPAKGGEPGLIAVMVSDTGVGVPAEHQERIWDKFHQVDSSSRRLFGGTGLGLAITKGLVELHGGRVWVESDGIPGRGSTFAFTIPVAQQRDQ